jgi:divalent metal cation (Fe/Co/Zn/Cd) transporter
MKLADFSMRSSFDIAISFSLFFSVCDLLAVGFFLGCGFAASSTSLIADSNNSVSDSVLLIAVAIYMLLGV